MLKRPFKSLIARIAIVALALSLVVPFVPAAFAQDTSFNYAEGGTGPVATFTAIDADGDAIVWSLSGADAEDFTIVGGVLAFKSSPNYESPGDEGADNTYNVTLEASGGSRDVVVTVTNVDEMGSVDIDDLQPQAGEAMTADVSDPDSESLEQTRWQWSKSMDEAAWEDISGATSAGYTPKTGDIGYYLQATATYSDSLGTGRDSASAATAFAVEKRPVSNAQPAFADDGDAEGAQQTRTVRETAKVGTSVGNAVTASDADNDPLLYGLLDGDGDATDSDSTEATPSDRDGDSLNFKIDSKTGQITTAVEMPDQDVETPDAESYTVRVTATDPSGSTAMVVVTINIEEVDEAPSIARATGNLGEQDLGRTPGGPFVFNTVEEASLLLTGEGSSDDPFGADLPVFDADDPEDAEEAAITWSLSGPDAKRFDIRKVDANTTPDGVNSSAALRWADGDGPSFEDKDSADGDNVYDVTVTVFDGKVGKSQDVNINVTNVEEDGEVTLTQRTPQEGRAVTARLTDNDGGVTGAQWQWYRGGTKATSTTDPRTNNSDVDGLVTIPETAPDDCDADTADDELCTIDGATSSTYTPTEDDADELLTARVTYTDALGDETNSARATSENDAVARPDENAQPTFGDDESVDRSVEENDNKANVGEPVTATDSDNHALLYTLSGDGSDAFSVNDSGQITTAKALDFETQSSYSVMVTATDPSGASDSITVNITVTDADDGATISANGSISYAENGTGPVTSFTATDADGDAIVWSLSGADAEDFTIEGGVLAFKSSPNYENPGDEGADNIYNVTVNASGGSTDVVVTVTNVDEMGSVDIDDLQPQAGEAMTADVSDPDSESLEQTRWQWSKSMDEAAWEDISGATSAGYTPKTGDIGYYLQATATYSDSLGTGRDSASAATAFAVEKRPVSNAQPAFADDGDAEGAQQTRTVRETAKVGTSVGNAVTASDADNDPLLYGLLDGDGDATDSDSTEATPSDRDGDSLNFKNRLQDGTDHDCCGNAGPGRRDA